MQAKSFFQSLNQRQCQALQALERYRGSSLQNANPFEPRFADTPAGKSAREFLETKYPMEAAEFRQMVEGFAPSLQAVMYDQGWVEKTKEIHEEKMSTDPMYRQQWEANVKAEEERILKDMDDKVREIKLARGEDPDEVQVVNPHLMGRHFKNYGEQLNLDARRERNWQQQQG